MDRWARMGLCYDYVGVLDGLYKLVLAWAVWDSLRCNSRLSYSRNGKYRITSIHPPLPTPNHKIQINTNNQPPPSSPHPRFRKSIRLCILPYTFPPPLSLPTLPHQQTPINNPREPLPLSLPSFSRNSSSSAQSHLFILIVPGFKVLFG